MRVFSINREEQPRRSSEAAGLFPRCLVGREIQGEMLKLFEEFR